MKQLTLVCLLGILGFSGCKNGSSNEILSKSLDFTVELDTVKVDPGDELIYVGWNLNSSGVSPDGKYFYNFNRTKPISLEVINLENLVLEKIIPMELEGPNGLRSEYISEIIIPENGNLIFSDSYQLTHFDSQLQKLKAIRLDKEEYITNILPEGKRVWFEQSFSPDGNRMVAFYTGHNIGDDYEGIISIDFEKETARIIPLDILKSWKKHTTALTLNGSVVGGTGSMKTILFQDHKVVFGVAAENKAYFLDLKTDSLSSKTYQSQFTSPTSTRTFPENVETEEEFRQVSKDRQKEVRHYNFHYDAKNQLYWRFTTESTGAPKVVLTAFSRDFEQLGEVLLDEKFVYPAKLFVRDGMIYTFLNQDDEVYFVRLKPQIKS